MKDLPFDPFGSAGDEPVDWRPFYDWFVGLVAAGFTEDQAMSLIVKMIAGFNRKEG